MPQIITVREFEESIQENRKDRFYTIIPGVPQEALDGLAKMNERSPDLLILLQQIYYAGTENLGAKRPRVKPTKTQNTFD